MKGYMAILRLIIELGQVQKPLVKWNNGGGGIEARGNKLYYSGGPEKTPPDKVSANGVLCKGHKTSFSTLNFVIISRCQILLNCSQVLAC